MKRIKALLATQTLKRSGITFGGTIANAFLGAVFYILAARFLGPSGFGVLNVAVLVMTLTADIGDLGTHTGIVNFVAKYINKKREKAYRFLKLGLEVNFAMGFLSILIGIFASGFVASVFFQDTEMQMPLQIAFYGVLTFLIFTFTVQSLQGFQKFWSWSFVQVGANLLRLILLLVILYWGILDVNTTLWVYILAPFVGFLIGIKIIGTDFLKVKNENKVFKEFFKYNKWVALFAIFAALSARLDTFLSARLLDSYEVGIYSAANQMVKIVPQIVLAVGTVIGPKMAGLTDFNEFWSYFKKTQALVLGLSLVGVLTIPIVIFLIPYIFGNEYIESAKSFVVLFFAMIVFLISVPVHQAVFYYFSYPKLFFYVSFFHLLIVFVLGWFLISSFGVLGASYTVLAAQTFDFIVPAIWVFGKVRKEKAV